MTTIHTAYRRAFRTPFIIAGVVFAGLLTFLAGTIVSTHWLFFANVAQGCVQSLTNLFNGEHLGFLSALVSVLIFTSLFIGSFVRQWFVTRRFLRLLSRSSAQVDSSQDDSLVIIENAEMQCFCAGFLNPRIYIARHLIQSLTRTELDAVLAHEEVHRRNRDPLRSALLRSLVHAFFFLPIVRLFERRYHEAKEIMADEAALALPNGKQSLAAALYALARHPQPLSSAFAFFADRTLLDLRIAFMSGHVYIPLPITWSKIIMSALILMTPIVFFIAPSHAETVPLAPCREAQTIETHPFSTSPLRYDFSHIR